MTGAVVWVLTYWLTMGGPGGGARAEAQLVLPTKAACLATARAINGISLADGFVIQAGGCLDQERP